MHRITVLIMVLMTMIFCSSTAQNSLVQAFKLSDQTLESAIEKNGIIGVNYAILINGKTVHQKSYGLAQIPLAVPLKITHRFPVASISKLFSSIALIHLLDTHKISIQTPIGNVLQGNQILPEKWKSIRIASLLSHTSGIPDQIDYQIYLAPPSDEYVLQALKEKAFDSPPGTKSKYNATGFLLVRLLIERLSGQSFENFMNSQYLKPSGLSSAVYGGFKKVLPNRVTCYQTVADHLEMFPLNYSPVMYAGAGLNINLPDLCSWFEQLLAEKYVARSTLNNLWNPVLLNDGSAGNFGLGWEAKIIDESIRINGHGGAGIASIKHYWGKGLKQEITVIILTNGAKNWQLRPHQINAQIAQVLLENLP